MSLSLFALLGSEHSSGSGALFQVFFFGMIFVAMYFLLIRPQRRRSAEAKSLQSNLAEGDEVLLTSGFYGFVSGFDGDVMWVEIAENVEVRVTRGAVARRIDPKVESAGGEEVATDDDSTK